MTTSAEQTITLHPRTVAAPAPKTGAERWSVDAIEALFNLPLPELMHQAQTIHRENFDPTQVEFATLLSVKTGGCAEDCGYCPQSARFTTGVEDSKLIQLADVLGAAKAAKAVPVKKAVPEKKAAPVKKAAKAAKAAGASRFCMGAAWRGPKQRDLEPVLEMVEAVKALGLETCATLGLLKDGQAEQRIEGEQHAGGGGGQPVALLDLQLGEAVHARVALRERRDAGQHRILVDHRGRARGRHMHALQAGGTHADVGDRLGVADSVVAAHLATAMRKLDVGSRTTMSVKAAMLKLAAC